MGRLRIDCPKTRKRCYGTEQTATEALHMIWAHSRPRLAPTRVYHCKHCGWWHLTSHWSEEHAKRRSAA